MFNLLDYSQNSLKEFLQSQGEAPYRAQQILKWIHQVGETDFLKMSNLSLKLRNYLHENACIKLPKVVKTQQAKDFTYKWLLELECGNCLDTITTFKL